MLQISLITFCPELWGCFPVISTVINNLTEWDEAMEMTDFGVGLWKGPKVRIQGAWHWEKPHLSRREELAI